jgi:hypothetical protein
MINNIIVYNRGINDDLHYIPKDNIITCRGVKSNYEVYIKHIIDTYDNLDDYTIFIHGNPEVHIFPESKGESYNTIWKTLVQNKDYKFKFISIQFTPEFVNDSVMFVVSKEQILKSSKESWIEILNDIQQYELDNNGLEKMWNQLSDN